MAVSLSVMGAIAQLPVLFRNLEQNEKLHQSHPALAKPPWMRMTLLCASIVLLSLIPIGTAVLLRLFTDEVALVPVWFWLVWLVVSLGVTLEAPALAAALALSRHGRDALAVARLVAGLGILNVASTLAALFFLVSKKPLG